MEGSITVSMINFIKNNIIYIILFVLFIYKGIFVNVIANINTLVTKNNNNELTEINLLKEENKKLTKDIEEITKLKSTYNNEYKLTRLSYRLTFADNEFFITGSDYNVNDLLVNEHGLVGLVKEIKKDYSVAATIKSIKNLSININNSFGTISNFDGEFFIANNLSNYDEVHVNDAVYTSKVGDTLNIVLVGYVNKIEEHEVSKTIYIKSDVDFNNLNYLYVIG